MTVSDENWSPGAGEQAAVRGADRTLLTAALLTAAQQRSAAFIQVAKTLF